MSELQSTNDHNYLAIKVRRVRREAIENASNAIKVAWLTLGLLLIVDLRPLTFLAVIGLGVAGGWGTGVE